MTHYPPLPKSVQGAGGTIEVRLVVTVGPLAEDNLGQFIADQRRIEIKKGLRGDVRWLVYYHELAHAALWDSGAHNVVPGAAEEIVCDALATARVRERFG